MISSFVISDLWVRHPRLFVLLVCIPLVSSGFGCAKRSRSVATYATSLSNIQNNPASQRVNINAASAKQLEALPGIGKGLAERIVEHRQKYGPFAKPEHLIMVRGISEHRFQVIRDQITVD